MLRLPFDHAPKKEYVCPAAFPYLCIHVTHQYNHFPFGYCVHSYLLLLVEVFSGRDGMAVQRGLVGPYSVTALMVNAESFP